MSLLWYRSFFLGILLTCLVWIVSLCLYLAISKSPAVQVPVRHKLIARHGGAVEKFRSDRGANVDGNNVANPMKFRLPNWKQNLINSDEAQDENQFKQARQRVIQSSDKKTQNVMELGMINSPDDQQVKDQGYKRHAFNVLISNRLGYLRSVPDTRHPLCKRQVYSPYVPTASVIVCFYNEDPVTLLRTVYSVLDRTPANLLQEILLVDDYSDDEELKNKVNAALKEPLPVKVTLIRTPERAGLIRARMFGAHHATGKVLVFLDSHCEVNKMWLEPLLDRIRTNRTTVVCPIIDIINADTFEYTASPIVRGGFNWGLHFKWDSVPHNMLLNKEDFVKPIKSPTMAGGLFAIDRDYYFKMGEYDKGMDIWGGENLEISFRIWMCGGTLEIIPCSRVGHVFRRRRPYGSPTGEDTLTHNSLRVAHVWMDDYKKYYFDTRPEAKNKPYGDISGRVELRKKLNCKSFDWYLKNVYPGLKLPSLTEAKLVGKVLEFRKTGPKQGYWRRPPPSVVNHFQIQLSGTNLCIESEDEVTSKGSTFILQRCSPIKRQLWAETVKHDFRLAELLCLDAGSHYPRLSKCHEMGGNQEWKYKNLRNTAFFNLAAGLCLGAKKPVQGEHVTMDICNSPEARKWNLVQKS